VAVQQLEERLGTRLLQRTTRSVRLTEDGERFLERCKDYLAEGEQLATMFRADAGGLTGRLRIDLPATVARDLVIPRLPEFLALHPALEIGISTTDRRVDLVNEGFDCVLRVGVLGDSELVARPLGFMRMANAASPAYLKAHGTPHTLADLAQHRIVHFAQTLSPNDAGWEYFDAAQGRYRMQPVRSLVTVNGTDAYNAAAVAGLGLIQAPARRPAALLCGRLAGAGDAGLCRAPHAGVAGVRQPAPARAARARGDELADRTARALLRRGQRHRVHGRCARLR
jgi:DNA-binding transcriptional LysR family regulator